MKVSVTYALPDRQAWLEVEVPEQATVRDAIEASGIVRAFPALDLSCQKVGIFGKTVALEARLEAGQRVEICLLYTSPSPRDRTRSRMPSSA